MCCCNVKVIAIIVRIFVFAEFLYSLIFKTCNFCEGYFYVECKKRIC
jgi:hypothetical protein